jgi:hypothetical protein
MDIHANAALGPAGRLALVEAIDSGMTLRAAAAAPTSRRQRPTAGGIWRAASKAERQSGSWLLDRPCTLTASPSDCLRQRRNRSSCALVARPAPAAWRGSAGARARRSGRSSIATGSPGGADRIESYRRYEWSRPEALLHVDVARLARFERPGHAVTGIRDKAPRAGRRRLRLPALCDRRPLPGMPTSSSIPIRVEAPRLRCWSGRSSTSRRLA